MRIGDRPGEVRGGPVVEAVGKYQADFPVQEGQHTWVAMAVFNVNPERFFQEPIYMDLENMLSIEGPGCLHCEQPWHEGISDVCPGEP